MNAATPGRATAAGPVIRPASPAELNEVILLERESPTAPHWPSADYRALLFSPVQAQQETHVIHGGGLRRVLLVARAEGELAGFAVGRAVGSRPEVESELESVVVRCSERRQGLGTALCRAIMDWARAEGAREMALEVRARSAGAILLYGGLGFVSTARRRGYYSNPPDDALLMHCALAGAPSRPSGHRALAGMLDV